MRPVLLAAATTVALLAPLTTLPASASAQAACNGRYLRLDRVTQGGRQAILWKCAGDAYHHAQIIRGVKGDRVFVRVYDPTTSPPSRKGSWGIILTSNGWANTKAQKLKDGQAAKVCLWLNGAGQERCSKAQPYVEACDDFESGTTTVTIPRSCRA
ncbi:hypothetical protein [Nonomuraea fuscirosea]|uniref:hypothetical protein n=1 Tax=Nonomuraea fuscirosea TaxID=1291556 RepID=UPI0033D0BBFC